jgi:outer membrane receptor for ferrienterochelin and colicins
VQERTFAQRIFPDTPRMNRSGLLLLLLPGIACAATPLTELGLEELMEMPIETVRGASKYEQHVTRAPSSVSVVTAEDIRRFGYRTLLDVLQSMRGVYVSDDRNYTYVGLRGFMRPSDYNNRLLLLVDGHRMNENVYGSAYFGRESPIPVEAIERVELVRGPSSSIYGDSAFLGIVNVITRHSEQGRQGMEMSAAAASRDTFEGRLGHSMQWNDAQLSFDLSGYKSGGESRLYYPEFDPRVSTLALAANDGIASNVDGEEAAGFFATFRQGALNVTSSFSYRDKEVPTASFETLFNDGDERTVDLRGYLDAKYTHDLDERTQLVGRAYYDVFRYVGYYPYEGEQEGFDLDRVVLRDEGSGDWVGTEWQVTRRLGGGHTFVGGVEYREDLRQQQHALYQTQPSVDYHSSDLDARNAAAFAQAEINVTRKLLINAGARLDYYFQRFGRTINPRLAAIYSPDEKTQIKALFGTAFRSASVYEQYYQFAGVERDLLLPERIRTSEIAVDRYFHRNYRLGVSAYRYFVKNLITQTVDAEGEIFFDNVARVRASGVELEMEARFLSGVQARASYARQRAKDALTGLELSNSPRHLAQVNVALPFFDGRLLLGSQLDYHGSVRTLAGEETKSFLLSSFTLTHRPSDGLELAAGIYNVFDERYGYPGAEDHVQDIIPQDGRTFRLKITRRF